MFACTVYVLYDVYFILVVVSFKSSVELVCIVYNAPNLNKAFEKKKKKDQAKFFRMDVKSKELRI